VILYPNFDEEVEFLIFKRDVFEIDTFTHLL